MKSTEILGLRRIGGALLACAFVLNLNGCQSLGAYGGYAADPIDISKASKSAPLLDSLKTRVLGIEKCYATQYQPGPGSSGVCAGQRNQAISLLMTESAFLCVEHLSAIYGKEATVNIATGSIASISSAMASISPIGRAKTLSGLSSISSAERSLVNETVYKNLLTTAIATKIEEMRSASGKALLAKKTQTYDSYRIEDALSDVLDYHGTCAFHRGLELALKEGTNTNTASKRQALEVQAQALQSRIDTRAIILGMDASARRNLLDDNSGTASIKDPIMKNLVDQYQATNQEILALAPTTVAPKNTSQTGAPSVDLAQEGAGDPVAALTAAISNVAMAPTSIAGQLAIEAKPGDKELSRTYVDDLKTKIDLSASFRATMQAALLPVAGAGAADNISKVLSEYADAQGKYAAAKPTLDQNKLADQQTEIGLVAEVQKKVLAVKMVISKIGKCENAALKKLSDFKAAELTALKNIPAAQLETLAAGLLTAGPTWAATPDTSKCLQ